MGKAMDDLMAAMDTHQPDWWITNADQQDLANCVKQCTDGHSGTVQAKKRLRNQVFGKMLMPIRAAIECGLVVPTLKSDIE